MTDWARLEQLAAERPHDGRRFINRYPTPHHGLREFLRWQRQTGGRFPRRLPFPLRRPDPAELAAPAPQPRCTWLAKATASYSSTETRSRATHSQRISSRSAEPPT